jgi:hypothetical protein
MNVSGIGLRYAPALAIARRAVLAAALLSGAAVAAVPQTALAAGCVRFVASNWDSPGNDNYMPQLNQEWVRIKNTCSSAQAIGGWRITDYKTYHTYRFKSGVSIGAGKAITLKSGCGSDTATTKFWGGGYSNCYGAIWNNTGTEKATLKNSAGATVSTWVE